LKIRFLFPARRELVDAIHYYNAQRVRLGDEFRDEAWETIQRIQKFPQAWHPLGGRLDDARCIAFLTVLSMSPENRRFSSLQLRTSIKRRNIGALACGEV
jgi:hypothetical protein